MQHTLDAARELEGALHELMRVLDSGSVDPAALAQAAEACETGFVALRAGVEIDGEAARPALVDALRTHAIAIDLANRRLQDVRGQLERMRSARRTLQTVRGSQATGGSCDLAG